MRVPLGLCLAVVAIGATVAAGPSARAISETGTPAADHVASTSAHISGRGWLYYFHNEHIVRRSLRTGRTTQIVRAFNGSIVGMAIADHHLYWATATGFRDGVKEVSLTARDPKAHWLVRHVNDPAGLVAVHGYIYWAGESAIGRVRPNGTHLNRRLISGHTQGGIGIAGGLATDGSHLYFSRCGDRSIARADLDGSDVDFSYIPIPGRAPCPGGLAVGNTHLYWAATGGHIGRATLNGSAVNGSWLNVHTNQGAFEVAADDSHVYWSWGGETITPYSVGRATIGGGGFIKRYLLGEGAFLLTTPGANR